VLSIGKMVARSEEYYLRTVAAGREEYYTGSGEAPGYWMGQGAAALGLTGEVVPEDLRAVLAGFSPAGQVLTAGRVDPTHRVSGFDLTWSAPKSVSLLYGLGDPETSAVVRRVHAEAVAQSLGYLERRALRLRRGAGGDRHIEAKGLVAAAFMHRTSRSGDPQLHTHVLVTNVAEGTDAEWSAPDARLLYFHARTAGFLYQAALRAGLSDELGVRFGPVVQGSAEVQGISRVLLRAFSTRRRQIERHLELTGGSSAGAAEAAALITRGAKEPLALDTPSGYLPHHGLFERWQAQVAELGFSGAELTAVLDGLRGGIARLPLGTEGLESLLDHLVGPEGLTASDSTFERRDVVRAVAEALAGGASVAEVEGVAEMVFRRREVVALSSVGQGGEVRHTTTELLDVEAHLIEAALSRRESSAGVVGEQCRRAELSNFPLLASEQVQMVSRLVSSGHGVEAVVGKAGAGKTLALAAARDAWESAGLSVLGTALSARAARGLQDGAGIPSDTLARVLAQIDAGTLVLGPTYVVVLDEAGMVGTRSLASLIEVTNQAGAKLVIVGDPRQLPEIEAGGAFAALVERLGAIELAENHRQHQPWERSALDALRLGRAPVALASYDRAGRVHTAPTLAVARDELVSAWLGAREAGQDTVMLAVTRRDVAALNEGARVALRRAGRLGPDVMDIEGTGFALGDRVVCLRNDRRLGVLNGTCGSVVEVRRGGLVLATGIGEHLLPERYLAAGHLAHGYALTVHKSQGATVDRVFVLATESLTREAGYVAMSRARLGSELFVPLSAMEDGLAGETVHDPRGEVREDPLREVTRRLMISRAKRLVTSELGHECSAARIPQFGPHDPAGPSVGGDDVPWAEGGRMGIVDAGQVEASVNFRAIDEDPDDTSQPHVRQRLGHELILRPHLARSEEHDRSWGLSR
jgi:conjugative relaxase-like TrwC/TraI family protein